MDSKNEYNSTATNAINCYSNLQSYGVGKGIFNPIIDPFPAQNLSHIPIALLKAMRPYKIPPHLENNHNLYSTNCNDYKYLNQVKPCDYN
jgi:hypothetical protein